MNRSSSSDAPVQVTVLNYNNWRDTLECLDSVFRLDYPSYRVVVCDNGSADDSVDRIIAWARAETSVPSPDGPLRDVAPRHPGPIPFVLLDRAAAERGEGGDAPLTIIRNGQNLGFSGGNNVALRYALARERERDRDRDAYVWLLNNDTVVAADTLTHLVAESARDANYFAVGATILYYDRPAVIQEMAGGRFFAWRARGSPVAAGTPYGDPLPDASVLDFVSGCSALVSLTMLERVGLMDERLFVYGDDLEWGARAKRGGFRLGHAQHARVWHKGMRTVGGRSPTYDYLSVRSSFLVSYSISPVYAAVATFTALYEMVLPKIVRRQWDRLGAVARGYRDFLGDVAARKQPITR